MALVLRGRQEGARTVSAPASSATERRRLRRAATRPRRNGLGPAQAGFKSVINNRPDFEGGPDQPTNASIEAAAKAAGLRYAFLPVQPAGANARRHRELRRAAGRSAEADPPRVLPHRHALRQTLYRAATGG